MTLVTEPKLLVYVVQNAIYVSYIFSLFSPIHETLLKRF